MLCGRTKGEQIWWPRCRQLLLCLAFFYHLLGCISSTIELLCALFYQFLTPHPSAEPFLPEVFSRFSHLPQPMSWVASLSPGRRFSHPFCASASEMPSRTAGTWKWIIRCSCYPRVTMKPKRGLLPQCESAVVVKGLGNCLLQQHVSDEFYGARRGGGTAEKKPP